MKFIIFSFLILVGAEYCEGAVEISYEYVKTNDCLYAAEWFIKKYHEILFSQKDLKANKLRWMFEVSSLEPKSVGNSIQYYITIKIIRVQDNQIKTTTTLGTIQILVVGWKQGETMNYTLKWPTSREELEEIIIDLKN